MKAQISFVEFLTSMIIFVGFVAYFSLFTLSSVSSYLAEIRMERLRVEAYQLSELLMNDPGEPLNWNTNFLNAKRPGLLDHTQNKTNLLSKSKIDEFRLRCQLNYESVKSKLGTDLNFLIVLRLEGSEAVCSPPIVPEKSKGSIARVFAYLDGAEIKYGEMVVNVW